MKPTRSFPDTTRMTPPSGDPSAVDPSSTDPSLAGASDGPVLESKSVAPSTGDGSVAGRGSVADGSGLQASDTSPPAANDGMPPKSTMAVFRELAKCSNLGELTAHVIGHPEILDLLQSRRGMLPVFSDKPPPTFPAPGQLRSYDDYVDVLFTKQPDGSWKSVNYSR